MAEWKLPEDKKKIYDGLYTSARDLESALGAATYKIAKMTNMRIEIDAEIKKWWDATIEDLGIDKNRDYMIKDDGTIQDVTPQKPEAPAAPVADAQEAEVVVEDSIAKELS